MDFIIDMLINFVDAAIDFWINKITNKFANKKIGNVVYDN